MLPNKSYIFEIIAFYNNDNNKILLWIHFLLVISKMIKIEHFFAGCVINLQGSKILPKGTVYDRATVESHKPLINL